MFVNSNNFFTNKMKSCNWYRSNSRMLLIDSTFHINQFSEKFTHELGNQQFQQALKNVKKNIPDLTCSS